MLNDKLSKSLADLDAAADELLKKSADAAADDDEKDKEEPAPEDISDGAPAADEPEDKENSEDKDLEKCSDSKLSKSEDTEDTDDKQEPEEEDKDVENEPEGTEDEYKEEETTKDDVEKSIKDDFTSNDAINKALQTSEFQAAVVDVLVKALGEIEYGMHSSNKDNAKATSVMAKSMQAVLLSNKELSAENEALKRRVIKLEKSISMGFDRVLDAIDTMSSEPAHQRKSMANINVHDKDFSKSINGSGAIGGFESLSKSQVLTVLNNELYSGSQLVTAQDIISYESGAPLRAELQPLVVSKCK